MQTTIDQAGRLVIPKVLRERLGLVPGPVEIEEHGAGIRVVPLAGEDLVERDGFLVIPKSGITLDDESVRELRDADQT